MNSILIKKKNITSIQKKYIISTSDIEKKINKKLLDLQKKIVINGFRKGKVPKKIIEERYKNNIFNKILKKIIHKNFIQLIQKKNIQNYKNIKYSFGKYTPGTDFNYTIKFDVILDKLIQQFKLITLYNLNIYISEENINQVILNFQKNISNWKVKNTAIKKNDKVTINYYLKLKNHNINILEKENFLIFMNKNFLLRKIFYAVIEKKIGDQITLNIDFSKYHPEKKIAGKKTTILIKIINVQEKKIKKINFKKFKKFGFIEKNIEELKKNIYIQMQEESKKITREYLKKQFIKKWIKIKKIKKYLKKNNKITPIIKKNIFKYKETFLSQYKKNKNIFEKLYNKNIHKASQKKSIIDILIKKIIHKKSLSISQKLIKKIFKSTSEDFLKDKQKNTVVNKKIIIQHIKNFLLQEKAFNFIFKNVVIKNKKIDFKNALKKNKNNYL
ncbi:Trigger factor [Buchnera aphidicola (Chaitophorus sp. 3695)]|uniref:trigger factor n=1 Tax=Buchnera aphidicola TaxID=9 RepID=UPI0034644D4E